MTLKDILERGKAEGKDLDVKSVCFTLGFLAGQASKEAGASKAADCQKNVAILFVKPHANNEKVQALIADSLKTMGLEVLSQRTVTAVEIEKGALAAKHYYAIASKAGYVPSFDSPAQLNVPKDKFKAKFNVDYDAAVADGKVFSGAGACKYLGVTKDELDNINYKQKKAGNLIKFGGGFYCGQLDDKVAGKKIYVFNAFCGNMLDAYVAKSSQGVTIFKIQWDEAKLSWADFRSQKLGPTDPATAPADSLRGLVYANWEKLGLAKQPNVGLNGVHGSASPFEAMAEVENWCGESLESQPFYKQLLDAGVSAKQIDEWKYEAQIVVDDTGKKGSSFDAVEDIDSTTCIAAFAKLALLN